MMKSANGPWMPVVPGTEGGTSAWWCNCSPSPPQPWGLNREPILAWGSQMAHTAAAHRKGPVFTARGRNHSQVSNSQSWLGLRQENQRQTEGSPGREHSRTWPSRNPSPACRLLLFITCSQQLGALIALLRSPSLYCDDWAGKVLFRGHRTDGEGSRRHCGWTCSRGVSQSDVHRLGVSALYMQSMCVSESEAWLPGGLICLLKGHLSPTQAWSVFVSIPLCAVRKSLYFTLHSMCSLNQLVSTFCEVSVS